jgi:NAD(P)-dependent dehydrogenase (short-subunit alcohol dehydrogenase family)
MSAGKVVLITGASGGIGAALAEACAKAGYRVALVARREEELKKVATACGGAPNAVYAVADVTVPEQVNAAVQSVVAQLGPIEVLVNNAGRGCYFLPSAMTPELLADQISVNVNSALLTTSAILPSMIQRNDGIILNVSSVLGRYSSPVAMRRSAYIAAKHALNGYTVALRHEMMSSEATRNVKIALASPGPVDTDFGTNANGPASSTNPAAQKVDECAASILQQIRVLGSGDTTMPAVRAALENYTGDVNGQMEWYSTILAQYGRWGAQEK